MDKEQKEKIAISAANTWCRCFKCDGVVMPSCSKCEKEKRLTCHKWYDGYRTALLALSEYEQQMIKDAVSAKVTEIYYPTDSCLEIEATLPEGRFEDGDKVLIIKED